MMPGSGDDDVLSSTGGQIDGVVLALIDSLLDKNDTVTSSLSNSLFNVGKHQPNLVLSCCHSYVSRHSKLPLAHRILVLGVMKRVCVEALDSIKHRLVVDLIHQAAEEIVTTKEIVPEWQGVASGILVSLGRKFQNDVMECLLTKFQPGVIPHFFVVQTIADMASANVFGMVPYFKAILGTMLPLLCTVKHDNMKWIFAYALARFSEAILEYLANVEKAPDPTVTKDSFMNEISCAYDVLFGTWLQSRETKVRAEVVVALGHMSHLLSAEKLEERLPKFIPAILLLYKKHQEDHSTTQGLCMVLDAAVSYKSGALELQFDGVVNTLFPQVCNVVDYAQPSSVKNHNEILRCFAVLTSAYAERVVVFLLQKLEYSHEGSQIGALTVLKHLINSCDSHLKKKIPIIISSLRLVLESGNKVKKVLAQVIVALAHHGYLECDGGFDMVLFVVHQCALPDDVAAKRPNDPAYVSNEALRGMCENVIHLLTTTVERMENVLWPHLLDCLLTENLRSAVSPLCKSLTSLAAKKREEMGTDFHIDFKSLTNVPDAQALFARLFTLCGQPKEGRNKGIHILRFLKITAPAIHKNLRALWDTKIPALLSELEAYDELDWDQQKWENQLVDFLVCTLKEVDHEEWTLKLSLALENQFRFYVSSPSDKYVLLQNLGIVLRKIGTKTSVNRALDTIFNNVNHSNLIERKGCAIATGYCGASHFDAVLVKLEQVAKDDQRNSSFFSFLKDFKGDSDHEKLKATIILCYGYVAMNGPISIMATRAETPILRNVAHFYQSSKDPVVKHSMLEAVKLIADAVHPSRLSESFSLRSRNELLSLMKIILKNEPPMTLTNSLRSLALAATSSLVSLDPPLLREEKNSLICIAVSSVYSLPRDCLVQRPKEETADTTLDFDHLLFSTVDALNLMLRQLLLKEKTYDNLLTIIQILDVWMISKHDIERERCMHSVLHLLQSYTIASGSDSYSPFSSLGSILGILVPRCTDPQVTVRHLAFDSIDALLSLAFKNQVCVDSSDKDHLNASLGSLKQQTINDDPSSLFSVTKELGKVISDKLPADQVVPFLKSLLDGLCDLHSQSSSGTSVVLNRVIKLRGREVRQEVPALVNDMMSKLESIQCPQTYRGALLSIQNMAIHHLSTVLSLLLASPLPIKQHTVDIWKTLVQNVSLSNLIIEQCIEVLSENILVDSPDQQPRRDTGQFATSKPLAAVCALKEIFTVSEMEQCGKDNFDRLFSTLLLVIGTYVGVSMPAADGKSHAISTSSKKSSSKLPTADGKSHAISTSSKKSSSKLPHTSPIRCAIEALKSFLLCVQEDHIIYMMTENGQWVAMEDPEKYPEAIISLGSFLCLNSSKYIPKIVAFLSPMLNSSVEVQRIVTVALFVEFLSQSYSGKSSLVEPLVNNLLGRLVDSSHTVRRLCIRALGKIGVLEKDQVQRYSTTVLSAMMAGMDDKNDPDCSITLEAMSGLSSVLVEVAEEDIRSILVNIALRIKPMFDKDKAPVRAAAFTLYGNLSRFGCGPSKEAFIEQVHSNLVTMLLHLNDDDKHVVKSCKYALRLLGPLLDSSAMNSMFQKHLLDDAHLHYGEFINDLTKTVIADFAEKVNSYATTCMTYLRSPFPSLQCNATAFLGYLLGNLPVDRHSLISKEKVCGALIALLKDHSPEVRIRAGESLSLLYKY